MVYLYKNKLPNYGENIHVIYDDVSKFTEYLGTPFMTFEEDKYTLNNNTVQIELPSVSDIKDVTYIAWNVEGMWKFFFVRTSMYQSGYAVFEIEDDLWGTYISNSVINLYVEYCNRNIGPGFFRPIEHLNTNIKTEIQILPMSVEDLAIVYVVMFSTGVSTIFNNGAGSYLGMYATELGGLDVPGSVIDYAVQIVGNINGRKLESGTTLDANVLKAFIVPRSILSPTVNTSLPTFKTKGNIIEIELTPDYEVAAGFKTLEYTRRCFPGYSYFVGTRFRNIQIPTGTQEIKTIFNFLSLQDGIQVIASCGTLMMDLTPSFQVGLTTNNTQVNTLEKISGILNTAGAISSSLFQINAGGAGYVTGGISLASSLQGIITNSNGRYVEGGDALLNFRNYDGSVHSPFYEVYYNSTEDELFKLKNYGAFFNREMELNYIFNFDFIEEADFTYIQGKPFFVRGVHAAAQDLISQTFMTGVRCIKL